MRIALPADFEAAWTFDFLAGRIAPALEALTPNREYRRSLRLAAGPMTLGVRLCAGKDGGSLEIRSAPSGPAVPAATLRRIVSRMFDLDADLPAFRALAAADPLLRTLVPRRPGLRLPQLADPFEGICRAVLGQQVSVAAASTLVDRLVRRFGEPAPPLDGVAFQTFPQPEVLAAAGATVLAEIGLTRAKSAALHGVAAATADGRLDWETLRRAPAEECHAILVALPGIGPWTASYVRMRALGDRDAFPAGDLGVVKALRALLPQGERLTAAEIAATGERWRPWRAYATLHLWNSLG